MLHLAAGLGYDKLIQALIRFKTDNPSLILDYEVDPLSIDDRTCNPLVNILSNLIKELFLAQTNEKNEEFC